MTWAKVGKFAKRNGVVKDKYIDADIAFEHAKKIIRMVDEAHKDAANSILRFP